MRGAATRATARLLTSRCDGRRWTTGRASTTSVSRKVEREGGHASTTTAKNTSWNRGRASTTRASVYDEPQIYELAFGFRDFKAEVEFLAECARRHGTYGGEGEGEGEARLTSLLELGCGPAWHSVEAATRGVQCVALDANASMRAFVSDKLAGMGGNAPKTIRVVDGDMRKIALEPMTKPANGFDVATMLLGTAAHLLTYDDAVSCLKSVRDNLRVGGLFVVELEHPWDLFSGDIANAVGDAWDRTDEENGVKVYVEWGRDGDAFDIETQVYERTVSFSLVENTDADVVDASIKVIKSVEEVVACKIFTQPEFNALAATAGLTCVASYGDMDHRMTLDDENAHNMVLVYRRDE